MVERVFHLFFGCRHKQLTRPITKVHRPGTPAGLVYVSCLECGKQFHYDPEAMEVGPAVTAADPLCDPLAERVALPKMAAGNPLPGGSRNPHRSRIDLSAVFRRLKADVSRAH
jgi:hypothetical protein